MSLDPQGLADMAKRMGAPHVFDHGMVGSLVQTFDSATMIDKYVPKLEEALDSLGRILFLFYWKPGDFQSAYGADDMSNMENKLLSNFQSFGNLVLDLMKKSRNKKEQLMYRTD
jgi:hypothetical protein